MRKLKIFLTGLILLLSLGATAGAGAAPVMQAGPQDWTVLSGGDSPDMAYVALQFYPAKLTINVGDTITWQHNSADIHTVIFPASGQEAPNFVVPPNAEGMIEQNPLSTFQVGGSTYDGSSLAGSGVMGAGPQSPTTYKLTFTKAGTYNYLCTVHAPVMAGTIVVQDAGSALPMAPDAALAAGKAKLAQDIAGAEGAVAQLPKPQDPDGATTHNVYISAPLPIVDYMRFTPDKLTIHQGDTVIWTQKSLGTPHTVTLPAGAEEPELEVVQPQQNGPPRIFVNSIAFFKQGNNVFNGEELRNSGFIFGTQAPVPGPRTYQLTFTKPGTYEFYCILHDNMGQKGYITVLADEGNVPGMPTTGGSDSFGFTFAGLVLAMGMLLAGLLVRLRRAGIRRG